jgi:hypothetical protein
MPSLNLRLYAGVLAALAASPLAHSAGGSTAYSVVKTATFVQKDSSGAVASSKYPYVFTAQAPTETTLGLPAGGTFPLSSVGGSTGDYEYAESFTSKVGNGGLDATFPNGTYQMTGAAVPTLSFPLSPDSYPSSIPEVTSGTSGAWSGGVLMIDPTISETLDFSPFSSFSGGSSPGFMMLKISDLNGSSPTLKKQEISVANSLGITQGSTPFTSYSIPSGTLTAGGIYEATLQFATVVGFDTATVPGNAVITLFQNEVIFYIVTPQAGVTTQPPVIATDLANQTATLGGSATLGPSVTVGGAPISGGFVTIWYLNGQQINIDGVKYVTNGTSLVINNLTAADGGVYFEKILNEGGLATTANAALTVSAAVGPAITTQPETQTINSGSTAVFTVVATGASTYQWEFSSDGGATWSNLSDGGAISGSAGPQLVIQGTGTANGGEYECLVSSAGASTLSSPATLSVVTATVPGYLVNISSRAFVGTGDSILIGGFFVGGTTSRSVLIQALGPALIDQGVSGVLQHPALTIHDSTGKVIYSNTGWGDSPVLLKAAASAYAQPVLQPNSADSEALLTLPPGGYTAEIAGADGGTGVALCAIYQLP